MMGKKLLAGKTIVVTGTARGIGKKMTERFAAHGANVFALARTETDEHRAYCEEVGARYGVQVMPVYFELTDTDAMKEGVKQVRAAGLPVDGLVNNAGVLPPSELMLMTRLSVLMETIETNFIAPYSFSKFIIKLMMKNGKGSIVNVASIAGLDGSEGDSAYGASKAAVINMTKCIAKELGVWGLRANALCPGVTMTDMNEIMGADNCTVEKESTPLGKLAQPEDIANAAVFLLSDLSSYITGQTIRVDGGVTTRARRA